MIQKKEKKTAKAKDKPLKNTKSTAQASSQAKMNKSTESKKNGGRPSKIEKVLEVFKEILNEGITVIVLTDAELVDKINLKLDPKDQISKRTFERYKEKSLSNTENKEDFSEKEHKIYGEFCRLIKRALIEQKTNLFNNLLSSSTSWQRYAWVIERKFEEWNLKHKTETEHSIRNMADLLNDLEKGKID